MSDTTITRRYHFESAHFLPFVPDGHRCKRMHGHNYEIEVTITGPIGEDGFIMDFWDLDKVLHPIIEQIDHRCLNDIKGLSNPTAELIAAWFMDEIANRLGSNQQCSEVKVWETKDCFATKVNK